MRLRIGIGDGDYFILPLTRRQRHPPQISDRSPSQCPDEGSIPANPSLACIGLVIPDQRQDALVIVLVRDGDGRAEPDLAAILLLGRVDDLGGVHALGQPAQPPVDLAQALATIDIVAILGAVERPKLVDTIAWAAGNGDRSENGDYIYGRKRLREIDRRLGWLSKRMKAAKVIDPARQEDRRKVWFGATVTIADEDDNERVLTLVGDDEADAGQGRVGWNAPLVRALRGAAVGDLRRVTLPAGEREYEVMAITYPDP